MSEAFIGEIRGFGFNFAPLGWAQCNGQLLPISQNTALFSVIGTTYGGDGSTTFALPNLQGQVPMHWGSGAGLNTVIGQPMGQSSVTLLTTQMPQHIHTVSAAPIPTGGAVERSAKPDSTSFLSTSKGAFIYKKVPATPDTPFSPKAIGTAGGSQPHENMQPYLVINFCIAVDGIFPPHS